MKQLNWTGNAQEFEYKRPRIRTYKTVEIDFTQKQFISFCVSNPQGLASEVK